jgi:hypothetical protein
MSIILTVLPYMYTGVAFLKAGLHKGMSGWRRSALVTVVVVASGYCLWVIAGSDAGLTRSAMILLFLSIPLYPIFSRGLAKRSVDSDV